MSRELLSKREEEILRELIKKRREKMGTKRRYVRGRMAIIRPKWMRPGRGRKKRKKREGNEDGEERSGTDA